MVLLEERHWLETHDKHNKMFTCEMGRGPSLKQISLSPQVRVTQVTHSGDRPLFVLFLPQTCVRVGGVWLTLFPEHLQEGVSSTLSICGHILPRGTRSVSVWAL